MKKRFVCFLGGLVALLCVSCDFFTTPLVSGRDLIVSLEGATAQEIVDLLNSDQVLSSDDSKGLTNALAKKSKSELDALSIEDKRTVVNTAAAGILPSPDEIIDLVDVSSFSSLDGNQMNEFMDSIIEGAIEAIDASVDVKAVETFFNDDETVKDLLKEGPDALILGTFALTVSIAKDSGVLDALTGDAASLEGLFSDTFTEIDKAFSNSEVNGDEKITQEEEDAAKTILAESLNTSPEKVGALLNVAVVLYTVSQEEGLESLGALESVFNEFLGAEVSTYTQGG